MVIREWPERELRCSFSDRRESEVERLFAGPRAYICGECVDLLHSVLHAELKPPTAS